MNELKYNDNTLIYYRYEPIYGSGNAFVGTRYKTRVFLSNGQYELGSFDTKLDEEDIKARVAEFFENKQERQYGQKGNQFLTRRTLRPVRDRLG